MRTIGYFGRLHLLEDITEQKRVSEALRRHDEIMSAVNFAADRFLKESDWKAEMDAVLERFGRATGTSAVHVFENGTDPVTGRAICIRRWGWRAEGLTPGSMTRSFRPSPAIRSLDGMMNSLPGGLSLEQHGNFRNLSRAISIS